MVLVSKKRNNIYLKTVNNKTGDENLQMANKNKITTNNKNKNCKIIFIADKKFLFLKNGVINKVKSK